VQPPPFDSGSVCPGRVARLATLPTDPAPCRPVLRLSYWDADRPCIARGTLDRPEELLRASPLTQLCLKVAMSVIIGFTVEVRMDSIRASLDRLFQPIFLVQPAQSRLHSHKAPSREAVTGSRWRWCPLPTIGCCVESPCGADIGGFFQSLGSESVMSRCACCFELK
jgi:hypothetical protein